MVPGSRMRLDLFNVTKGVCIEISPEATHGKFNKFFHGTPQTGYLASIKRDMDKLEWIEDNGFKYVELDDECINNLSKKMFEEKLEDVGEKLEKIKDKIHKVLEETAKNINEDINKHESFLNKLQENPDEYQLLMW
jgi:ElaB/YqjD/DUF883 family membrane-anchored ribosome-binding protein